MDDPIVEYSAERISDRRNEVQNSLLTVREVARLLSIHSNTVRNWGSLGILPSFRIGPRGDRRFRKEDVTPFLIK